MQLFPTSLATVTGKATILHLPKRSKSVTENTTSRLWYKTCECRRKKNAFRHQKSQHLVRTGPISQHHGWAYHCRADVAQCLFLGVTSDTPWASEQVLLPVHADALVGISLDSTWGVCVCVCVCTEFLRKIGTVFMGCNIRDARKERWHLRESIRRT